jgi:tRNA pseudouridine32 synthase / 23S rRNA pseudouridine746 synthase
VFGKKNDPIGGQNLIMNPPDLLLYADEALLVIHKPAGLPTLPDGYAPDAPHVRSVLEPEYGRLWIVHRLDRETSGVLALARTAQAHRSLNGQFEKHQTIKIYHALVNAGSPGGPDWEERTVRLPLRPNGDRRHRTVVDPRAGKPAVTHLRVLERFSGAALIEARPETGRTHQIRAHLAAEGLPIAADAVYGGGKEESPLLPRLGLHAFSLEFAHPLSGEPVRFTAPYPDDFAAALEQLRRG